MIFVDVSAMVAMIAGEADADTLAFRLEGDQIRPCTFSVGTAHEAVRSFRAPHGFQIVTIGDREFEIASSAYAQFGKGRHPAALNRGKCFADACAKTNRATLLFNGDDSPRRALRLTGERCRAPNRLGV